MIIFLPIGGIGKRFKENGYTKPKTLINIYGKPIISYILENINFNKIEYIYIIYNNEYENYNFEDFLKFKYPNINFKFHCLESNTNGAAETINIGIKNLNENRDIPVLCMDCDNFYTCDIISQWNGDNCVFTFKDENSIPIYSYVKSDHKNIIIDIKEKEKISHYASTGAYGFKSIKQLEEYTSIIIKKNITQKSEFYTSGVIKQMIDNGFTFYNKNICNSHYISLGTPIQLKIFYNNYPFKNSINNEISIKNKRICFDLDNTLVTFPNINGDYTTVKPIEKNINFLKYLKKLGNIIIIYTARRMKTHNGNIGKINSDIGKITFDTLDKFNIPYDEIYFGKPYADFYIDDLAVNCYNDLEKELGYYNNKIEPRDFNTIEINSINTIIKKGNIEGEKYYYANIPITLKDMFPLYLSGNNDSITIEKISGITVTELYLSQLLSENTFTHILESMDRIQKYNIDNNDKINIYENYAFKIIKRYKEYNYSKFKNSENIYNSLLLNLQEYEKKNLGKKTLIHGDPVFTNIIINNYGKIKFIDMRGKIGDKLTIYGDWLYDWAKIFQSIIGYDEILMNKSINNDYKEKFIMIFENYFINKFSHNDYNNLKLITKSHIFTLIPLHDNDKCSLYYKLLSSKFLKY